MRMVQKQGDTSVACMEVGWMPLLPQRRGWAKEGLRASTKEDGHVINTTVGLDLAKNVFQAFGLTPPGAPCGDAETRFQTADHAASRV